MCLEWSMKGIYILGLLLTRLIWNQLRNVRETQALLLALALHAYTQFVTNTGSNVRKIVFQASNESLIITANKACNTSTYAVCFQREANKQKLMATKLKLFRAIYSNDYDRKQFSGKLAMHMILVFGFFCWSINSSPFLIIHIILWHIKRHTEKVFRRTCRKRGIKTIDSRRGSSRTLNQIMASDFWMSITKTTVRQHTCML